MQRVRIVNVLAALAVLAVVPVGGALAAGNGAALFGKDPGTANAFACFKRHYDAKHLAAHPKQNVTDMNLFVNSYVDGDSGRQYALQIGVKFRKKVTLFQVSGGCGSFVDNDGTLACGIDCDGGSISVRLKDSKTMMVEIPEAVATYDPNEEDNGPSGPSGDFGSDDKLFKLERTSLTDCLPLVSDDEIKAELSHTQ